MYDLEDSIPDGRFMEKIICHNVDSKEVLAEFSQEALWYTDFVKASTARKLQIR